MKKLAIAMLVLIMFFCAACDNTKDREFFQPETATQTSVVITPETPDIIDTGVPETTGSDDSTGNPVSPEPSPGFFSPQQAIEEGMLHKYEGEGTEVVELKGFNITLGEMWVLTDENSQGAGNEKIIDGPVRYTTDDGANMVIYIQDNQQAWDATDEEVNKSVVDTIMQSSDSYILLEQSTLDTQLGKGLMIYYRMINPDDVEHNQRICLVLVPKDDKILAISAGAFDSNDEEVFAFACKAIGQALASAEAESL